MFARYHVTNLGSTALAALLLSWPSAWTQDTPPLPDQAVPPAQGPDPTSEQGYTVLAKGPVHEAYAQPHQKNPEPTPVVPKKPPAPVPEEPPDQKPKGDNVQWIPGYWSWDPDKQDYIWVSGLWRVSPPGRQWVPGYWTDADGGSRWVAGYWAAADQDEAQIVPAEADYLPDPPASLDYGPNVPAPNQDSLYVPGNWVYRSTRYLWQPGFWTTGHDNWVWNAPSYSWTPAGCVYVNGYWDYPLADRGLLFAPVSFNQPLWTDPGWCYRPNCVFGVGGLLSGLFCRPSWCSYYYGNYFSPSYAGLGFQPWCHYGWHGFGYDPLFNHYGWANRFNPGWHGGLRNDFLARRNGFLPVPADTLAHQAARAGLGNGRPFPRTVTPLSQFHASHGQLARLDGAQLGRQRAGTQQFRALANQRGQTERALATGARGLRQGFGTASTARFEKPRAGGGVGNGRAGQVRASPQDRFSGNGPHGRSGIPAQRGFPAYGSPGQNGSPADARSYRPPANFRGGQGFAAAAVRSNGVPVNRSASSPVGHGVTPGMGVPRMIPRAPTSGLGLPANRQGSHVTPSFSRSAPSFRGAPSYSRPAPSFHGGTPSFHGGGMPSNRGGGGGHFSGGHPGGGAHTSAGHGSGHHR